MDERMRRLWHRGKFHLSALVLLVPLPFIPAQFGGTTVFDPPEIERTVTAGPYTVRLVTSVHGPHREPTGEMMKDYAVHVESVGLGTIRGVFLRVGKPRSVRTLGALAEGNPYELGAEVTIPPTLSGDEELWLTVESWDGGLHQAALPLDQLLGGR